MLQRYSQSRRLLSYRPFPEKVPTGTTPRGHSPIDGFMVGMTEWWNSTSQIMERPGTVRPAALWIALLVMFRAEPSDRTSKNPDRQPFKNSLWTNQKWLIFLPGFHRGFLSNSCIEKNTQIPKLTNWRTTMILTTTTTNDEQFTISQVSQKILTQKCIFHGISCQCIPVVWYQYNGASPESTQVQWTL